MLEAMLAHTRVRACMAAGAAAMLLAACGVPPLHRSVVVERNADGVPVHASGKVDNNGGYTVMRGDTLYSIAFRANVDFHQLAAWNGISEPYVIHPGQHLRLTRPDNMPAAQPQAPVFRTVASADNGSANGSASEPGAVFETVPSKPADTSGVTTASGSDTSGNAVADNNGQPLGPAVPASTVVAVAGEEPVATPKPAPESTPEPSTHVGATHAVGGITWSWPAKGKVVGRFNAADAIPGINIAGKSGDPVRAAAEGVVVYSGNGLVGYGELIIIKHNDDYLSAYGHNSKRLVKEGEHVKAGQEIARMGSGGGSRDALEFQVRYKGKPVDPLKYLPAG